MLILVAKILKDFNNFIPPHIAYNQNIAKFFYNGWLLFEQHHKIDNNNNLLMSLSWDHHF
jgi:hypothetical protein